MPLLIVLFAAGIALLQQQAALPPLSWSAVLVPLLALAWLLRTRRKLLFVLLAVSVMIAGLSYATLRAQWRLADELPAQWEGRDIQISGVVASLHVEYG